jgi:hypothetical protein
MHTTHNGVSLLEKVEELRDELHIEFNCARITCGREKFRRLNQRNREGLAGAGVNEPGTTTSVMSLTGSSARSTKASVRMPPTSIICFISASY